jgi:hypothetical protein
MEFQEITEHVKASPGEYIYHEPSRQIVLCGSFNRTSGKIKALAQGKLITDDINNFKKIRTSSDIERQNYISRCKGCGK